MPEPQPDPATRPMVSTGPMIFGATGSQPSARLSRQNTGHPLVRTLAIVTGECANCSAPLAAGARFCAQCGLQVALTCTNCDADLNPGDKFCASCGTPTDAAPRLGAHAAEHETVPPAAVTDDAAATEARKVISVLFADLVGFTEATEQSDPEDVRARLTAYHTRFREDIERHGGRIEKLLGDGVFAVFGAPHAHEDDPERAVRSALRAQQSVDELNEQRPELALSVRIAVTTGEAIVQLDTTNVDREGIVGDVVNTASRLQGVAPAGGVVVDERTFSATKAVIDYEGLDPVNVKGKASPIPLWLATAAKARLGVALEDRMTTSFIGRAHELSLLVDAFDRTVTERRAQVATISGEPGVGKSRLVAEFRRVLDDRPDVVLWRQGRCLPYGEGIGYNALSEVVKAQAGILQAESPASARDKLHDAVANAVGDDDAQWVGRALEALVGLEEDEEPLQPEEAAAGWRRFIGALTDSGPLVLVIEDLHWADEGLLGFLNELPSWAFDLPIFLVCTARPEIYSERPEWASTSRNAIDVGLSPLSEPDIAGLLDEMVDTSGLSDEEHSELVARCGGNPLYAIEYASLVREGGGQLAPPDSVHALIAARLDLLDSDTRLFLQAASVVGRVFWTQALMYMLSSDADAADSAIRELRSRELVWPVRMSSMSEQTEYMFRHVLVRDVAYGQIPRADRARLHENVGRWMEARSVENLAETAAQLAHHYGTANVLRRQLGEERQDLAEQAFRFTLLAAEQAANLDGQAALQLYQQAADAAPDKRSRAETLVALASIQHDAAGTIEESAANATEAAALFEELGDAANQALAIAQRSRNHWLSNDGASANADRNRALELVEGQPPSPAVARVLRQVATGWAIDGSDPERATALAMQALEMTRQTGSPADLAMALRVAGDAVSIKDVEWARRLHSEALDIAVDNDLTREEIYIRNNMHAHLIWTDGALATLDLIEGGVKLARQRGIENADMFLSTSRIENLLWLGRWREALGEFEGLLDMAQTRSAMVADMLRTFRSLIELMMGDTDRAPKTLIETQCRALEVKDMQAVIPTTSYAIAAKHLTGDRDGAKELAEQLFNYEGTVAAAFLAASCWLSAEPLIDLGFAHPLKAALASAESAQHRVSAALAEVGMGLVALRTGDATGGLARIAPGRAALGAADFRVPEHAARIWEAEALWATGDEAGAQAALAAAQEFFDEIGAGMYLKQIEALDFT